MGFTAINSSGTALANHHPDNTAPAHPSATKQNVSIASGYLGRGEAEQAATSSNAAVKKTTAKGKKRAATAPNAKAAKRRKTSNVDEAMPSAKTRSSAKKPSVKKSADSSLQDQTALQHGQSAASFKGDLVTLRLSRQGAQADSTSAFALVSVVAPSTSMGSLNGVSQRTSLDAIKASTGHGTMLYSTSSSPTKQQSAVCFKQPLLHRSQNFRANVDQDADHERIAAPGTHRGSAASDEDDKEDFGALFDELAQQLEAKVPSDDTHAISKSSRTTRATAKKTRQQPARKAVQPIEDEYSFIDDDDELAEALVEAEMAATKSRKPSKKQNDKESHAAEQLPTPTNSDNIEKAQESTTGSNERNETSKFEHVMIASYDEDEEMIEFEKAMRAAEKSGLKPRLHSQNVRTVDSDEDYGGALLDEAEKKLLYQLRSATQSNPTKPIVRSSFPPPILDRSPLLGVTNGTVLRTCFRLGEALNVGSQAVRSNKTALLELYARIASSFRDGRKQHFIFRDLYHDKPPHLEGDFGLWSQSQLWQLDSKPFLKAEERDGGVMCRAIAKMKRDGMKWRLEVLSIWEAKWEDIEAVAGIYAKGGDVGAG